MSAPPKRQRGVALLVALLVVALAVILIAALLDRGELALARTRNVLRSEQAEAYAQGLENYAAQVLSATAGLGADTNASPWAVPLPPQPMPGGLISATMRDLNGCFNLNNLGPGSLDAGTSLTIFTALLTHLGIDPALAAAVQSWVAPNATADDAGYLALPVPYRPRHGPFAHVSELRLVRGVGGEVYARLAPYVCALPPGTTINVNTASAPLLWSLDDHLSQAAAEKLWSNGQANYRGKDAFLPAAAAAGATTIAARSGLLDVTSSYFLARGDIVLDDVPFTFYSLIERRQGAGIQVLERSRGSDDALVAPAPLGAAHARDQALD